MSPPPPADPARRDLPDPPATAPQPAAAMEAAWAAPRGWRALSEVNNTFIGQGYVAMGLVFLVLGGLLAVLIRVQLAVPGNDFLTGEKYNQVFTMHGTTMMFLFAVPVMEAVATFILPQQLGARDLPFPRLSAYGFWCYAIGGLISFGSIFFWVAPNSGWFLYPPLSAQFSEGINNDFWLLGIGFIEISAIAFTVEVTVGVMKTRAPGMSLDRMPVYAWYMLVTALMIGFGFPPLILGDVLLEMERLAGWPFFDATRGGDPVLWQHLFWLFGHPEVYIIFLPAAGLVSTMLPTFARVPLAGYSWIVLAAIATGFLSFGLWVHHMYATGIPHLSLSFFSAASLAVAIPSGIQVFAWIATIWSGRPVLRVPMLYILGFLFIFVLGGLTGVMVAVVPFDWQVHDTYFVVAHLHYVLFGGMVFPLFGALYYFMPLASGRMMSERLGTVAFWLIFIGFNVTFFTMHITGLLGMPRRVYTYPAGFGWDLLNLISSLGTVVLTAGIGVLLYDLASHFFTGRKAGRDPWQAGTLEWATGTPALKSAFPSLPHVAGRYPLWNDPDLPRRIAAREGLLATAPDRRRETLRTSSVDAHPEQVLRLPGPDFRPLLAAVATAAVFILLIFKLYVLVALSAVAMLALLLVWAWDNEALPEGEDGRDVGGGLVLPYRILGPASHAWWAAVTMVLVDGSAYAALVFGYFYLWTVSPAWPPEGGTQTVPLAAAAWEWALAAALAAAAMGALSWLGVRADRLGLRRGLVGLKAAAALAGLGAAATLVGALRASGLDPAASAYGAVVWMMLLFPVFHLLVAAVMQGLTAVKAAVRPRGLGWSLTAEATMVWSVWSAAQTLFSLGVVLAAPAWL
ncbi:cytochrome c oxidase subunit I [Rhodocista pekingensis]|uniref:cytochrome-c oxidase n=1 Tax=Rhodocista pekingensis TaxID=201185 RepID=A0ABW2KU56_9PROT